MQKKTLKRFAGPRSSAKTKSTPQLQDGDPSRQLVLYVEDNPDNWEVTRLALRRRFRLLWAKNSREACDLILANLGQISCILMDIELKGSDLDGIEITQLVRGKLEPAKIPPYGNGFPVIELPIIFVTAFSARYSSEELIAVGGSKLITKPVNFAELSLALSKLQLKQAATSAAEVLKEASRAGVTQEELSKLVGSDQGFTMRMLGLLNTGMMSVAGPVPDAATACNLLGVEGMRQVALTLAVMDIVPEGQGAPYLVVESLRRAVAARAVAKEIAPELQDVAFNTGLLLESGLLQRGRHDLAGALELGRSPARSRTIRERAAGEVEHPVRGAQLARDWGLPDEVVYAVMHHHDVAAPTDRLARIAWAAEWVATVYEGGDIRHNRLQAVDAIRKLGIEMAGLPERIIAAVPKSVKELAAVFRSEIPPQPTLDTLELQSNASLDSMNRTYNDLVRMLESLVSENSLLMKRLHEANQRILSAFEKDLALIAAVQEFFLPRRTLQQTSRFEVCGFYRAASRCGGDWWWCDSRSPDALSVLVGDVTGHGVGAAMITAATAGSFRALRKVIDPQALDKLLERMHGDLAETANGRYHMTMSAALLDDRASRLCSWSAGAPPPLLLHANGKVDVLASRGTPLGLSAVEFSLGYRECDLAPRDRLMICTDGLFEVALPNGRQLGLRGLARIFAETASLTTEQAANHIIAQVDATREDGPQDDDMTLVVISVKS